MKVVLMWSGDPCHGVAIALGDFLDLVLPGPNYFISDAIQGGEPWRAALAEQLGDAEFGIACLTRDALSSQWLHFEAGVVWKAVQRDNVIPLFVGMKAGDVTGPLADFQGMEATRDGVAVLVGRLAATFSPARSEKSLLKAIEAAWPPLEAVVKAALSPAPTVQVPAREDREILEEILERVRRILPAIDEAEPRPSDDLLAAMLIDVQRALVAHPGGPGKQHLRSIRATILSGKMTNRVFLATRDWVSQELQSRKITPTQTE